MDFRTVSKKRYEHDFLDGELVHDTEYNETFVFRDKVDGYRAQTSGKLRKATEEEKVKFERYKQPDRP